MSEFREAAASLACMAIARAYNIGRKDGYRRNREISEFPEARLMQQAIINGDVTEMRRLTALIREINDAPLSKAETQP